MKRRVAVLSLAALVVLAVLGPAVVVWAGPKLVDFFSTCTSINCSSMSITGTYTHDQSSNADPFIMQLFTAGSECVRVEVTSQPTDLEMVLTCPTGTVWRDDDGGEGLEPLIKARTPAGRGWCTLHVSHFVGEGISGDFFLRYGRYPTLNINCASPTPPQLGTAEETKKEVGLETGEGAAREGGSEPAQP